MKNRMRIVAVFLLIASLFAVSALAAESAEVPAAESAESSSVSAKAIAAGVAIGLAALGGALSMGLVGSKTSESIARQPEAEGKLRTGMMLTLVFIETAIIYALLTVILIIFVL